jgi:hypothetical protein
MPRIRIADKFTWDAVFDYSLSLRDEGPAYLEYSSGLEGMKWQFPEELELSPEAYAIAIQLVERTEEESDENAERVKVDFLD